MNDGEARVLRLLGIVYLDLLSIQEYLSGIHGVQARDDLHQRRFSGAVFADEPHHLSGQNFKINALENLIPEEGLGDSRRFQNRLQIFSPFPSFHSTIAQMRSAGPTPLLGPTRVTESAAARFANAAALWMSQL